MVMTGSEGHQKAADFLPKPCVTLQHENEWFELVKAHVNAIVLAQYESILKAVRQMGENAIVHGALYGAGDSTDEILMELCR